MLYNSIIRTLSILLRIVNLANNRPRHKFLPHDVVHDIRRYEMLHSDTL